MYFNSDGIPYASISFGYGAPVYAPSEPPTKGGHTFGGWYESDPSFTYDFTGSMPARDVTLHAIWSVNMYSVKYYIADLSGTIGEELTGLSTDYAYGEDFSIASAAGITPPAGKQLREWNTLPNGLGTGYAVGMPMTMGVEDITLYTIWMDETEEYTIEFRSNNGRFETLPDQVVNAGVTFSPSQPTGMIPPADKQFKGWNTDAEGNGDWYYPYMSHRMPECDLILYAVWEYVYNVVVVGGTASSASGPAGTPVTLTPSDIPGKQFKGWNVTAGGVTLTGNTFIIGTSNVVIEAEWDIIVRYSVTADTSENVVVLMFDCDINGLSDSDITIYGDGSVTKGSLTQTSSKMYILEVVMKTSGSVTVSLSLDGHIFIPENAGADTVTVSPKQIYISFATSTVWIRGTYGAFSITVGQSMNDLRYVLRDGYELTEGSDYTVTSGSTIVTIKELYMAGLEEGEHTFDLVFTTGIASAIITVSGVSTGSPAGGSDGGGSGMMIIAVIAVIAIVGIGAVFFLMKGRQGP
jgi:uncharacterized repeat protein (TIGR02543 family)